MRISGFILLAIAFSCLPRAAFAQEFKIVVKPMEVDSMASGPITIKLTVTYCGKEDTEVALNPYFDTEFRDIQFNVPEGWEERYKKLRPFIVNPENRGHVLKAGENISFRLYLHEYFSKTTVGTHTISAKIRINIIKSDSDPTTWSTLRTIEQKTKFTVKIVPFEEDKFSQYVDSILEKIKNSSLSQDERRKAAEETYYLTHPSLSKIYYTVLNGKEHFWDKYSAYCALMRNALKYESCLEALVDFLSTVENGEYSGAVFSVLNATGTILPNKHMDILLKSKSDKVRKYAREFVDYAEKHGFREHRPGETVREDHQQAEAERQSEEIPKPETVEKPVPEKREPKSQEGTQWRVPVLIVVGIVLAGIVLFLLLRGKRS